MNELQIETLKLTPAIIEFNHEQIEKELKENLKKYEGLTIQEDTVSDGRRTLAELRKGKKAINRFRIDTKDELTKTVKEFENKCKKLDKKFDEVIEPLDEQVKHYVQKQRDEKKEKVLEIIDEVIEEQEIDEKYRDEFTIESTDLSQSRTLRAIKESFEMVAQHVIIKQEKEKADKQVIKTTVDLANERYDVSLTTAPYIRLLEFEEMKTIKKQILDHAQEEVDRRLAEEKRKKAEEERRKAEEKKLEEIKRAEEVEEPAKEQEPEHEVSAPESVDEYAFIETTLTENYLINATREQHELIQKLLDDDGIDWEIEMGLPF